MRNQHWLLFEATPDGDPGGGGGEAPEPAAPEPAPAPEPPAEPPEGYVPRAEYEQLESRLGELEPLADLARNLPPGAFDPPGGEDRGPQLPPDPSLDPEGFVAWQQQREQDILSRFEPLLEDRYLSQAQTQLTDTLGRLPEDVRSLGLPEEHQERALEAIGHLTAAFLPPDLVEQVGQLPPQFADQMIQRALEQSAQQASSYLGEILELARTQGRDAYMASLRGDGEGREPDEPTVGASGIEGKGQASSYEEIIERNLGSLAS